MSFMTTVYQSKNLCDTIASITLNKENMSIQEDIQKLTIEAMKAKDSTRVNTLKGLKAGFTNELVAQKMTPSDPVSDEIALTIIKRQVKQRKDSIKQFTDGGRPELAEQEAVELAILDEFLPEQMSEEEVTAIVDAKIAELGITDKSGMGQLMGAVVKETAGNADGGMIKQIVDSKLS
jgi:uncharacterized protein